MRRSLLNSFDIRQSELPSLIYSFLYFFSLLCAYYILRPLRDEMGIAGGIENLHWVFTGTFVTMLCVLPLYGWLSTRYPRRKFLPWMYLFFIASLMVFYFLMTSSISMTYVARAFFIWISVFNLFVVSIFWSFMADLHDEDQARRLFGLIAAGGTTGAITGPLLTATLVNWLGTAHLLLISITFLSIAIFCIYRLILLNEDPSDSDNSNEIIGGHWYQGFGLVLRSPYLLSIAGFIVLYSTVATFLYFQQATIVRDTFATSEDRTMAFAWIDLAVNSLTVLIQLFFTGRIVSKLGLGFALAIVPVLLCIGFIALGVAPVFMVLVVIQVLRRAGNYALMRPAREMLYVILPREQKYKSKGFIDTAVYRGGDAASAWVYAALSGFGLSLSQLAWVAIPFCAVWAMLGIKLGKWHKRLSPDKE